MRELRGILHAYVTWIPGVLMHEIKVGLSVSVKGYTTPFVVMEIRHSEGRVGLRSYQREPNQSGYYGTHVKTLREGYLWFGVDIADIESVNPGVMPPGVVTMLARSGDSYGAYKKAIVSGERFPEIAFHDPSWTDFLQILHSRGYVIPPDIEVELGIAEEGRTHGIYDLVDLVDLGLS